LEHVSKEHEEVFAKNLVRVLKPGGTLILATPYAGRLEKLDVLNLKFHFPRLYRSLGLEKKSQEKDATYHRHYSEAQIERLFCQGLKEANILRRGGATRILLSIVDGILWKIHYPFSRWVSNHFLYGIMARNMEQDHGIYSSDIYLIAKK
jgi:SAM-dependent methyltransferase